MSDIINILPDSIANQIAAGEVVDRPASAVKELLENAIDAGATNIQLIVKDAGRTLIQVIDNGSGMSEGDARRCIERHATSKIHKADDLFNLHTMGFRGEALASIASIAQVEIKSRTCDNELGTWVEIDGCAIQNQTPCNCPVGTSISVKNLFYNIPARRNFLKKDSVELSHIEEVFKRIAIVHFDIAFSFYSNGRMLYALKEGNMAQRIANIFGNHYNERLYRIDENSDIANISGYVGKAEFSKKTRGEQYLFVNGRFIKHPGLSAAIEKAYTDIIPDHFYPSYFVCLNVDPSRIDVNIHPTKTEVKFIDEHPLFAILRASTRKALGQFSLASEIEFNPSTDLDFSPLPKGTIPAEPTVHYNPHYNPFEPQFPKPPTSQQQWKNFFEPSDSSQNSPLPTLPLDLPDEPLAIDSQNALPAVSCFQIQQQWIVGEMPSGILVVDQHLAHERVIFDRLMNMKDSSAAQQLLFPINCSFSPADAELFADLVPDLESKGFVIAPLGKNSFVVSATPPLVSDSELQSLFDKMIEEYKSSMLQKFSNRNQSLCLSMARHLSVKSGTPLHQQEMQQIIADLFSCPVPQTSPSGKKTFVIISNDDIRQMF